MAFGQTRLVFSFPGALPQATMNMAFGQNLTLNFSWGVAPGYDEDGLRPKQFPSSVACNGKETGSRIFTFAKVW